MLPTFVSSREPVRVPATRPTEDLDAVREAQVSDTAAMGRVMVEAWLTGHHGQMPEAAWQKRRDEWTPEISAAAWERNLPRTRRDPWVTGGVPDRRRR